MNHHALQASRATISCGLLALLSAAALLVGCGGGSSSGEGDAPTTMGNSGAGSTTGASCPVASVSDVWMDQRLGCTSVGAKFIDIAANYVSTGTVVADTAYVVNETAYDTNFDNVLGTTQTTRFWSHFLCVRHAPQLAAGEGYQLGLATDLQVALGLGNFSDRLPQGIGAVSFGAYTGGQSGIVFAVNETCDPAKHPVIVDYTTGLVESLNPRALASQVTYTR